MSSADTIFRKEMDEFTETMTLMGSLRWPLPAPSILEAQYALNHLFLPITQRQISNSDFKHQEKSSGHLHRAHLDYLKSYVIEVQQRLAHASSIREAHLLGFCQGTLRKKELSMLGLTDRTEIFPKYRNLIKNIEKVCGSKQIEILPSTCPPEFPSISCDTSLRKKAELYIQWANLEAMYTALSGDRHYSHIATVVYAYFKDKLGFILPRFIAVLKLSLLQLCEKAYGGKSLFRNIKDDYVSRIWTKRREHTFDLSNNNLLSCLEDDFTSFEHDVNILFHYYEKLANDI